MENLSKHLPRGFPVVDLPGMERKGPNAESYALGLGAAVLTIAVPCMYFGDHHTVMCGVLLAALIFCVGAAGRLAFHDDYGRYARSGAHKFARKAILPLTCLTSVAIGLCSFGLVGMLAGAGAGILLAHGIMRVWGMRAAKKPGRP